MNTPRECISCGTSSQEFSEPGHLDKWQGIEQWTCPKCIAEFAAEADRKSTDQELAIRYGVAVYQVGEVYGNAPPATLKKWFVAVKSDSFQAYNVESIPLAKTEAEAWHNAVKYLRLRPGTDQEPLQMSLL